MNGRKRIFSLILACLLVLLVCACDSTGGGSETDPSGDGRGSTEASITTEASTTTGNQGAQEPSEEETTDGREQGYQEAINDLRRLLENTYSDAELCSEEWILTLSSQSDADLPMAAKQTEWKDLYERFVSFGDYKQSREMVERFSVIQNGSVSVQQISRLQNGGEHITDNVDNYILDDLGRRVWQGFDYKGWGGTVFVYDEDGRLIREGNTFHQYDEQGRLTLSRELTADLDTYMAVVYTYDDGGNCIQKICRYKTAVNITYTYTYDDQGRVIHAENLYERPHDRVSSKRIIDYTYTYDDEENCILIKQHSVGQGGIYSSTIDVVEIYSQAGNLMDSFDYFCSATDCADAYVTDVQYENGLPVRIAFANGSTFVFSYSTAYLFDDTGLTLSVS
ncbi:MAG: hypothetical protein IJY42_04795 [Clostridia bacterium]|nr:hypothetical protein [Clostridia bacterium]